MPHFTGLDSSSYLPEEELAARILTPALAVHLDLVRHNVRRIIEHLDGNTDRWRPHVKTTKLPQVWSIMAEEGIRNFKCATTRELDVLLSTLDRVGHGDADVLVSYPHRPPALGRLAAIANSHPRARVSVLVEDPAVIPLVPQALEIFIDLNPGMNRTGVPAEDTEILLSLVTLAGPRYRGLHWYDGHVHDLDLDDRRAEVERGLNRATQLIQFIADQLNITTGELISSGTPAFLSSLQSHPAASCPGTLHRLSPGTVVFHDLFSEITNKDLGLLPAAVLLTRIISHPSADLVTCDAGTKSIAADGQPLAEVIGHPHLRPLVPSEEHLPFQVNSGERPLRGKLLALVPGHICPTVNLAEEVLLFDRRHFLGSAPVAARAHDTLVPETVHGTSVGPVYPP